VKTRLVVWLAVELAIASTISAGSCILRRDKVLAFRAWRKNPTPQTQAELERQQRITFLDHITFATVLFGGMAVITIPVIAVQDSKKRVP